MIVKIVLLALFIAVCLTTGTLSLYNSLSVTLFTFTIFWYAFIIFKQESTPNMIRNSIRSFSFYNQEVNLSVQSFSGILKFSDFPFGFIINLDTRKFYSLPYIPDFSITSLLDANNRRYIRWNTRNILLSHPLNKVIDWSSHEVWFPKSNILRVVFSSERFSYPSFKVVKGIIWIVEYFRLFEIAFILEIRIFYLVPRWQNK